MTLGEILALAPAERDRLAFTRIMGGKIRVIADGDEVWTNGDGSQTGWCFGFQPSTDPAADYAVLDYVRRHWDPDDICTMRDTVKEIWDVRAWNQSNGCERTFPWGLTQYRPGDYTAAALAMAMAMAKKGETHD